MASQPLSLDRSRYIVPILDRALGVSSVSEQNVFEKSLDVMRTLRAKTRETVLLGVRGYRIAAIWITVPSSRLPDAELDRVGRTIRAAADVISGRFGCNMEEVQG